VTAPEPPEVREARRILDPAHARHGCLASIGRLVFGVGFAALGLYVVRWTHFDSRWGQAAAMIAVGCVALAPIGWDAGMTRHRVSWATGVLAAWEARRRER
jgi:hypothetical protein